MRILKISATIFVAILLCLPSVGVFAQKVGFISSDEIRKHFTEAKQADRRVQSIVEEWKRELKAMDQQIESLEFEIEKNRLIWTDEERESKERELEGLKTSRMTYAKTKFEPQGEYDQTVHLIMTPVEEKIYAAIQKVSMEKEYDIIWDKSVMPLPFVNFKYDLTVDVLKELGVDTKKLESELQQKINTDPRNQPKDRTTPKSRSRDRRIREIQQDRQNTEESRPSEEAPPNPEEFPGGEGAPPEESAPHFPPKEATPPR